MLMIKPKNVYKKASLVQFGKFLRSFLDSDSWPGFQSGVDQREFDNFKSSTEKAESNNAWFSRKMIRLSMESWAKNLSEDNIDKWMSKYDVPSSINKNVLIICAGNLPLVGFHDIVCCILLNINTQVKLSKNDNVLIPAILNVLYLFDSELQDRIKICNEKPDNYNYVIATGSNNSNRYFEYYFGKFPHIFRRNRTSIAVVHSEISDDQLKSLSHDMLQYYGLGCRSVTKLYLPEKFSLDRIYNSVFNYKDLINHNKYMNNYDYNRSIFLMGKKLFFDNGFLILKEDKSLFSPISVVNFEYYSSMETLEKELNVLSNEIQCMVGEGGIPFGTAQKPELWDYADGVDTIDFLTKI
jgi:hypothetical protein